MNCVVVSDCHQNEFYVFSEFDFDSRAEIKGPHGLLHRLKAKLRRIQIDTGWISDLYQPCATYFRERVLRALLLRKRSKPRYR